MSKTGLFLKYRFPPLYHFLYNLRHPKHFYTEISHERQLNTTLKNHSVKQIFTTYYKKNRWGDSESLSGASSTINRTKTLRSELLLLLKELKIKTMLDIPCGDFCWMKEIPLNLDNYIGADIVEELIQKNNQLYRNSQKEFQVLDILSDPLPKVDLIFCRDIFIHFSFQDIYKSLANIKKSGSIYLATSTFNKLKKNSDIITGSHHVLNFLQTPFYFPQPLQYLDEDIDPRFCSRPDKKIGIWKISDLS